MKWFHRSNIIFSLEECFIFRCLNLYVARKEIINVSDSVDCRYCNTVGSGELIWGKMCFFSLVRFFPFFFKLYVDALA